MAHKGRTVSLRSVFHLVLGLTALSGTASAWAQQRALDFEFEEGQGYGRIIASWKDGDEKGPKMTARMTGPVLVLSFDQPVSFDPEELPDGLPSYIAVARLTEDGKEARIALAREYRIHQSYSFDLAGIDLVSPALTTDPADIVSPLAAIKARQAKAAADAAEAARIAALPPPLPVQLRASESDGFSTLAFYWPESVTFKTEDADNALNLTFSRRGEADLAPVRIEPPTGMKTMTASNTESEWVARLELREGYWASAIKVDDAVLVRFREGVKPEGGSLDDAVLPLALQELVDALPAEGIEPPSIKPYPVAPQDTVIAEAVAEAPEEAPKDLLAGYRDEDNTEAVTLEPITPPRLWNEALDRAGKVSVNATAHSRGIDLDFAFQKEIPATIFRRHGAVWIAFPASGEFDLSANVRQSGFRIDQVRSPSGMALRVFVPDDLLVSIGQSGRLWTVKIGGEGNLASYSLKPSRTASFGGSGIIVDVPSAGTVFSLTDPEVGEELKLVPSLKHTTSMVNGLKFIEASFPVTDQGLLIIPFTDDLSILQRGERVLIGRDDGMALSNWGVDTELPTGQNLSPGFLDFARWKRGDVGEFWKNHSRLDHAAALGDISEWSGQSAMLDLARFYLAWELAPESYGPLSIAASGDPMLEQDAQWLSLKGAADVMMGRYTEALQTLDKSSVRSDPAVEAWRGLAYAETGDWRKARESFLRASSMIDAYVPEWAGRFHVAAARANIRMGDGASAEKHAMAAKRTGIPLMDGQANLTLGELALAADRKQDARSIFTKLLNNPDANTRVRAELATILLGRETGDMSLLDASDRLDTLRFRWRGDALEVEIVSALADALFDQRRYREALTLALSTTMQFPDLPGARELRIKMSDQFQALFLDGKADNLDPIAALALFYEFKDLTPIGPDGDRMIRKLANRLVAFDLLDPATELLAHQVENRNLIGSSRAKIAADLAAIYLMDKRPEDALRTISETRQTGLDDELRLERRLLEAAAHMELQRYGHAIELLEGMTDQRALDLLAEVHWRSRTWGPAGRALQRTLPSAGQPLTVQQAQTAVRAAVAFRLDGDRDGLIALRRDYTSGMANTDQADTFDLLTGSAEVSSTKLTDTIRALADTSTANAFVGSLKQRFGGAGGQP